VEQVELEAQEVVAVAAVAEAITVCLVPTLQVAQVSLFFAGTINIGN
jgi:hypothetical protein